MLLKDMAKDLDPKKLIRVEIDREEQEQHIFADIKFALLKCADLDIVSVEELPWTYVLKGDVNTSWKYPENTEKN